MPARGTVFRLHLALIGLIFTCNTQASDNSLEIPIKNIGLGTYYVMVKLPGIPGEQYMIDTGSGYTAINQNTLDLLKANKTASYVKEIKGILANGKTYVVPIWRVSQFSVNEQCILNNVEVAVFPGKTRQILGLNALKKVAPFSMSFDPPQLILSQCI